MSTVKLQGNDSKAPFDVSFKAACCSEILKVMMTDLGYTDDEVNDAIPVPAVNDKILRKAMEWAEHHKDDAEQAEDDENGDKRTDDIGAWDAEYTKVDQGTLLQLLEAANFLEMKGLYNLTCKTVANMIKGETPDKIRKNFNIQNDFTPEEEKQLRKENNWSEEK